MVEYFVASERIASRVLIAKMPGPIAKNFISSPPEIFAKRSRISLMNASCSSRSKAWRFSLRDQQSAFTVARKPHAVALCRTGFALELFDQVNEFAGRILRRPVDRRPHQLPLTRPTLRREVVGGQIVGSGEAIERLLRPPERQLSVLDSAASDRLPGIVDIGRIKEVELVAGFHFALEVHVVGIDVDERNDDSFRHAGGLRRRIKRPVDRAARMRLDRGELL